MGEGKACIINPMTEAEKQIFDLTCDKEKFKELIYTPIDEALQELKKRSEGHAMKNLQLPEPLVDAPKAVLFRHTATPNYEVRRFVNIVDGIGSLEPLILEYCKDTFRNENEWKYSLGKIPFFKGWDSKGGITLENLSVIDFNASNGKRIHSLETLWGQSLVDLHHELFSRVFPKLVNNVFDLSDWLSENGQFAKSYYKPFLKIFIKNGILFENFLLEEPELTFNRNVVLPSFVELMNETGLKPLIVPLEPTETEGSQFWLCHPYEDKAFVTTKLKR
jgi:hypothetical protein